jgi:hypothetical protein
MKLPPFFIQFVRYFTWHECWRRKNEFKGLDFFQLCAQSLKGIYRKAGSGDFEARTRSNGSLQVVAEQIVDVIDYFHSGGPSPTLCAMMRRGG